MLGCFFGLGRGRSVLGSFFNSFSFGFDACFAVRRWRIFFCPLLPRFQRDMFLIFIDLEFGLGSFFVLIFCFRFARGVFCLIFNGLAFELASVSGFAVAVLSASSRQTMFAPACRQAFFAPLFCVPLCGKHFFI